MAIENEQGPVPLKAIHIVLEAVDGRLTKLSFTPDGSFELVSQIARLASPQITERSVKRLTAPSTECAAEPHEPEDRTSHEAEPQQSTGKEKSPTTTLP